MPVVLHAWNCFKYLSAVIYESYFYTSLPFHFRVCACLSFSFAMITFWWEQMREMSKVDLMVATVQVKLFC